MTDVLAYLKAKSLNDTYPYPTYEDLLEATGLSVERCQYFGSYQGDAMAVVADEQGRKGITVWGYGSCSGCDHLEAITPHNWDGTPLDYSKVNAYADEMRAEVKWADEGQTVADLASTTLSDKPNYWYANDDEMREWLLAVASS